MDHPISLGELAAKLARPEGRETPDPGEYWNILRALSLSVIEEEFFSGTDVLMHNAAGEFVLFLPALRAEQKQAAREGRPLWVDDFTLSRPPSIPPAPDDGLAIRHADPGFCEALERVSKVRWCRVHINAAALFLRPAAARRYLERSTLVGAPRLRRQWFPEPAACVMIMAQPASAEAAIPEAAQLKSGAPPAEGAAEAPEPANQHPPTPPPLTGRPKSSALADWARENWGSDYSKLPGRETLLKLAREKPEFAKVTQNDVRDIRRKYATKEGKRGGAPTAS
jgi:hypothetical protein